MVVTGVSVLPNHLIGASQVQGDGKLQELNNSSSGRKTMIIQPKGFLSLSSQTQGKLVGWNN